MSRRKTLEDLAREGVDLEGMKVYDEDKRPYIITRQKSHSISAYIVGRDGREIGVEIKEMDYDKYFTRS